MKNKKISCYGILWTGGEYIVLKKKTGGNRMNFNKETQKLGFFETVFESTAEQSLDADINLPDYCPEIQRILKCTVIPNLNSVQNNSGRLTADATAVVRIFYVGEGGKTAAYEQSYPLQKFIESNKITSDSVAKVSINTDYVNCRAVNPRRVDVRAMMTFVFKVVKRREEGILCCAEGAGIQTMQEELNFASLSGVCERTFTLGEVVELKAEKLPVSQILNISSYAVVSETKIINNKALVKGDCTVKIYYIGEDSGTVDSVEHSMPISQIIEMDGITENCLCNLSLNVSSCEAAPKADTSGDMRLIDLNARISAFMVAFDEIPVTLINDAYSTEYEVKNTCKSMEILKYNDNFNNSFINKVVFESIGVSVDCILGVWCSDIRYNFNAKDSKCVIAGTYQANIIYRDSENQVGIIQKQVDFDYSAALKEKTERIMCFGSAVLLACSAAVAGESRLELKTEIAVSGIILSSGIKKYVSDIEFSEDAVKRDKSCALTIYFCDKGESVWNIARRYNTTVDAIMQENDLTEDVMGSSRMMLIPGA